MAVAEAAGVWGAAADTLLRLRRPGGPPTGGAGSEFWAAVSAGAGTEGAAAGCDRVRVATVATAVTSLYALLDVPEDATLEQIRAAYRRAAKSAHPDVGGDQEGWQRLQLAHDVLTDDARRRAYDETGSVKEPERDSAFADAVKWLSFAADDVLKNAQDATRVDMAARMRASLQRWVTESYQVMAKAEAQATALGAIRDRWSGSDVVRAMFASKVDGAMEGKRRAEQDMQAMKFALRLMEGATYRSDDGLAMLRWQPAIASKAGGQF